MAPEKQGEVMGSRMVEHLGAFARELEGKDLSEIPDQSAEYAKAAEPEPQLLGEQADTTDSDTSGLPTRQSKP